MIPRDMLQDTRRYGALMAPRERSVIESHLKAWDEIDRLRSALKATMDALDFIDEGKHEQAVASLGALSRVAR